MDAGGRVGRLVWGIRPGVLRRSLRDWGGYHRLRHRGGPGGAVLVGCTGRTGGQHMEGAGPGFTVEPSGGVQHR